MPLLQYRHWENGVQLLEESTLCLASLMMNLGQGMSLILRRKELQSQQSYFLINATMREYELWQNFRAHPTSSSERRIKSMLVPMKAGISDVALNVMYSHLEDSGSRLQIDDILLLGINGITELTKFLCRNGLLGSPQGDSIALDILRNITQDINRVEIIGDIPGIIPALVLRSIIGPIGCQIKALQVLILLSRRYKNKLKIITLGGFASALWHLSTGSEATVGAELIASLMDAQECELKFLKDGAAAKLVEFTSHKGIVTEGISRIVERISYFSVARLQFVDVLSQLPTGDTIRTRLTWSLLHFVQDDTLHCFQDNLKE